MSAWRRCASLPPTGGRSDDDGEGEDRRRLGARPVAGGRERHGDIVRWVAEEAKFAATVTQPAVPSSVLAMPTESAYR